MSELNYFIVFLSGYDNLSQSTCVGKMQALLQAKRRPCVGLANVPACGWVSFLFFVIIRSVVSFGFLRIGGNGRRYGLLPISKHCPVKLHESLLNAETLKLAISRQ
jgi:hypothetical protein